MDVGELVSNYPRLFHLAADHPYSVTVQRVPQDAG
jgi:hypothetical protein